MAQKGNTNSLSDAGVAARCLEAAAAGALLNVLINLPDLSDEAHVKATRERAVKVEQAVSERCQVIFQHVRGQIEGL